MPPKWRNSAAKRLLEEALNNGSIPLSASEMAPDVVYIQHIQFNDFPYPQFRDRLRDMRKRIHEAKQQAASDSDALDRDMQRHPRAAVDSRGVPRWESSLAEASLKADIANGRQTSMKPKELRASKNEYMNFPLTTFREHVYQEVKRRKYVAFLQSRGQP